MGHKKGLYILLIITLSIIYISTAANAAASTTTAALDITAADGKNVTLKIEGNIEAEQISDLWFASNPSLYNNTDIAFTLTGQQDTVHFMNMTVPKDALLGGTAPVVTIDGRLADQSGYSQDGGNFYVWFTASEPVDRSTVQITFLLTPKITTIQPSMGYLYTFGVATVSLLVAVLLVLLVYKRRSDKRALKLQAVLT